MVDKVTVALSNEGKTPEQIAHDVAMAKVADDNDGTLAIKDKDGNETFVTPEPAPDPNAVAVRPEGIPEKFWDVAKGEVNTAALLKSQQDGEAALLAAGKTPEPEVELKEGDEGYVKPAESPTSDVIAKASEAYATNGELSESDYASLEAAGMSKPMVDEYIAGQQAIVGNLENAAAEPFGGDFDNYNTAADWAAANLSEDEIKALDVQLTSTNPAIVKQGAAALQAKHAANADITPEVVIQGDGTQTTSGSAFKSSAEMQAAMRDPRYKTDEAYRQEVAAKLGRSDQKLFG